REEKYDWWELIHQAIGANGLPWLCIGDYNEILWAFKKKEGPDFTWNGRRGDGFVVQERLDRALIDMTCFPYKKPLKFKAFWAANPKCKEMNEQLCEPVTLDEIKAIIAFQMGALCPWTRQFLRYFF
ncbi:unnamed protein product, partial [Prunus brigantina]